jgi:hypothetical protein
MTPLPDIYKRIACSNSGGRTSAFMTQKVREAYGHNHEIVVTFANTGCEAAETLDFVKAQDDHWGTKTVWLEAVVGGEGVGIRHKVVTYETAARNGEPFEAFIAKYGIPNRMLPQCTSRLKTEVMEDYLKSIGWVRGVKLNYCTAIGIRADEIDRVSRRARDKAWFYPLADWGVEKDEVLSYMSRFPWDLKLKGEHYGNCTWCWKKSFRKLMTLAKNSPEVFDFPKRMETQYGHVKASKFARTFFRENKTVADIVAMSQQPFEEFVDTNATQFNEKLDVGSGCGESCEIGADDDGE